MSLEITLLGVLFLGGFVGFIVALALSFSKKLTYKAVAAVLGAALGGAPLAFMGNLAYERWMYPVGLVLGLISIRLLTVVKTSYTPFTHCRTRVIVASNESIWLLPSLTR